MHIHSVDAVLKRRFVERLEERARRLREACVRARWDEARREISLLRSGGERFQFTELQTAGRAAEEALHFSRGGVFPGLRKCSFFERNTGENPAQQIDLLLRVVDALVAERKIS